jgi:hypothetical protein
MDVIKELLEDIPLPKMVKVKMAFSAKKVADVEAAVRQELAKPGNLRQHKTRHAHRSRCWAAAAWPICQPWCRCW